MQVAAIAQLSEWASFFVIVGSSAGALIGLTFVVITLTAPTRQPDTERGIAAFTTPSVVHFGTALFVCALLTAPWPSSTPLAIPLGLSGVAGMLYTAITIQRQRHMQSYTAVMEDRLFYAVFPLIAYATLLVAAVALPSGQRWALFAIGGATLLVLFIGIHNTWDVATFITIHRSPEQGEKDE